jgi:hypothetical protein
MMMMWWISGLARRRTSCPLDGCWLHDLVTVTEDDGNREGWLEGVGNEWVVVAFGTRLYGTATALGVSLLRCQRKASLFNESLDRGEAVVLGLLFLLLAAG